MSRPAPSHDRERNTGSDRNYDRSHDRGDRNERGYTERHARDNNNNNGERSERFDRAPAANNNGGERDRFERERSTGGRDDRDRFDRNDRSGPRDDRYNNDDRRGGNDRYHNNDRYNNDRHNDRGNNDRYVERGNNDRRTSEYRNNDDNYNRGPRNNDNRNYDRNDRNNNNNDRPRRSYNNNNSSNNNSNSSSNNGPARRAPQAETEEEDFSDNSRVVKVSRATNPKKLAGAVAHITRQGECPQVLATGSNSINQAIKAVAISRAFLADSNIDLSCSPMFMNDKHTGLCLTLAKTNGVFDDENAYADSAHLKVGVESNPGKVAGAIANKLRNDERISIVAIGPDSVTAAVKAIALARNFVGPDGLDLTFRPSFTKIAGENNELDRSAVMIVVTAIRTGVPVSSPGGTVPQDDIASSQ